MCVCIYIYMYVSTFHCNKKSWTPNFGNTSSLRWFPLFIGQMRIALASYIAPCVHHWVVVGKTYVAEAWKTIGRSFSQGFPWVSPMGFPHLFGAEKVYPRRIPGLVQQTPHRALTALTSLEVALRWSRCCRPFMVILGVPSGKLT